MVKKKERKHMHGSGMSDWTGPLKNIKKARRNSNRELEGPKGAMEWHWQIRLKNIPRLFMYIKITRVKVESLKDKGENLCLESGDVN